MVRMLAYPVSRPCQNGELADSASRVGRWPRPAGHAGPRVAVLDADVHLEPADQLLVDQQPVFLAACGCNRPRTVSSKSSSVAPGAIPTAPTLETETLGHVAQLSAEPDHLVVQVRKRGGGRAVDLHRAALQLGTEALAEGRRRSSRAALAPAPRFAGWKSGAPPPRPDVPPTDMTPGPYDPNVSGRWPSLPGRGGTPHSPTHSAGGAAAVRLARTPGLRAVIRPLDRKEVDRLCAGVRDDQPARDGSPRPMS